MGKKIIKKNIEITITPKLIPFILGLGLWAYVAFYHMDLTGVIMSGIGILLYGYSIAKSKVEFKRWKNKKKKKEQ